MRAPLLCGPPAARLDPELAVPTSDPARRPDRRSEERGSFILYVEGPRDRSILRAWAQRLLPERAPDVLADAVILGGRRPARAVEHFRARAAGHPGLCVLDRDEDAASALEARGGARVLHLEPPAHRELPARCRARSGARCRCRRATTGSRRRSSASSRAPEDATGWRAFDAKRLLAETGPLARLLGRPLPLARIARATREDELHADVHDMFDRLRGGLERVACRAAPRSWRSRAGVLI